MGVLNILKIKKQETALNSDKNNSDFTNVSAGATKVMDNPSSIKTDIDLDALLKKKRIIKIISLPTEEVYLDYNYIDSTQMKERIKKYKEDIDNASNRWGVSKNLIAAMISQESSAGSLSKNLMKITFSSFEDDPFEVFDYNKNDYQKIVFTQKPDNYDSNEYIRITPNDLYNSKTNISIGTAILANYAEKMNYNVGITIQGYNSGESRIKKIVNHVGDIREVSKDQSNFSWTNYVEDESWVPKLDDNNNIIYDSNGNIVYKNVGDNNYIKNVLRYLKTEESSASDTTITFKKYDKEKDVINEINVNIVPSNNNNN